LRGAKCDLNTSIMPHDKPLPSPRKKSRAPRTIGLTRATELYEALAQDRPEPRTELNFTSPFTLVVAVALSAQATDVGVNKATAELFGVADTPEKMVALGEEGVAEHIRTIGLWRNKARHVIALSQMLIEKFDGVVPSTRDELQQLPGVGRKTANVVLNEAFGVPTIAVDTHVFRVSNRTGLAPGKTPEQVEAGLERTTPKQFKHGAHHWLILHGRYVCKAQTPECWHCAIAHLCKYTPKTPDPATVSKLGPGSNAAARKTGM
jgi:endonuclease III